MIRMIQFAATVALALTLAGCGGDDDSALRDQIAMLEMERDEAAAARMTAEDQVADLQAEVAQLEDDDSALRDQIAMLETERDEAAVARMAAEGQVADLQAEVAQLESDIATLMGRADISPADLAAIRADAAALRGQLAGRANISPDDLAALRSEVGTLRTEVARLMGRADISPADLAAIRAEVARLTNERMAAQMEQQARLDAQTNAGLGDGLARTIATPVYAASDVDTLANLLPGGQTIFAPLSASVRRGVNAYFPSHGATYLKAISSDGQGGFNVTWTIDGVDTPVHFSADTFVPNQAFVNNEDQYYSLYGFTDAFYPEDPADVDRTDGSSDFAYLDLVGWNLWPFADQLALMGFSTFGVRTMPDNLPTGSATYEGTMAAQRWEGDNPDFGRGGGRYLYGNLTLEADLSDMLLSGQIDGIHIPDWSSASGQNEPLEGSSIAIQSTGIGEAEFIASWVGSGPMDAARDKTLHGFEGTVVGEFYGPAAEEVGGVISGGRYGMEGGSDELLIGGFGAAQ